MELVLVRTMTRILRILIDFDLLDLALRALALVGAHHLQLPDAFEPVGQLCFIRESSDTYSVFGYWLRLIKGVV